MLTHLRLLTLSVLLPFGIASGQANAPTPATAPNPGGGQAAPQETQSPATPAQADVQHSPAATAPASAQPAAGGGSQAADGAAVPTIRTTSRLVVLDTVVLDRKGNVVTGLKQSDFHVTEQGAPQTILNFTTAGAFTPPATVDINSTADLDRLAPRAPVNIILLDEFNTLFQDMAFARYSLKKYLNKQPGLLQQPTMLVAVNLQKFEVLQDYTQDRGKILNALDHHFSAYPWQAHQFGWLSERYSQAFLTLLRVAEATEGHPGHKNMIWIGRGFPNLNLANIPVDGQRRIDNVVQEVVNKLRDARVTLYTIDPAGVQSNPGAYGQDAQDFDPFGGEYQFNKLAVATGGRTFYGRNDVDAEIGTSLRDGASFYTLTYRPTGAADNPDKFRKIVVTFDNPDYHAVAREGYYPNRGPARYDPAKPSMRLATELYAANSSNMTYDGVPLTLMPDSTDPDKFTVHVDAKGLVWSLPTDAEPRRAELIVMVTSFDKKGKELQHIARNYKVNASADAPPTGRLERAIDFKITVPHDPKAVRARFIIRVAATGRIGTADAPILPRPQTAAQVAPMPTQAPATTHP